MPSSPLLTDEVDGVVVVDNASSDGSLQAIQSLRERVRVIENVANLGFAGAINQAFEATTTPFVLIMNPDARATPGAVRALVNLFDDHPKAGIAGGFINDRYLPRPFPTMWSLVRENLGMSPSKSSLTDGDIHRVDQPAGAALMVRREAFDQVGGFDEQFYPAWYEDVDFCRSVSKSGWEIYYHSAAIFQHDGGYSLEALGFERFPVDVLRQPDSLYPETLRTPCPFHDSNRPRAGDADEDNQPAASSPRVLARPVGCNHGLDRKTVVQSPKSKVGKLSDVL